ncbi:MAG: hypothetical protein EOO20_22795 [Chryseobacterium sp.]|nr:MAG: hypothetical protein EOO20_22795 [Chryseobacterium sp.]
METQQLINNALEQYLGDYKRYHTIFLIGFVFFQSLLVIWVGVRMERLKALLKKTEIRFSRYHELQIEALRVAYQKLVLFGVANKRLLNDEYDINGHSMYRNGINHWISAHHDCINKLAYNKIVLPKELKEKITQAIVDFQQMIELLIGERNHLDAMEEDAQGDYHLMYEYSEKELAVINGKIERLKADQRIVKASANIRLLRDEIEAVFEKMNK